MMEDRHYMRESGFGSYGPQRSVTLMLLIANVVAFVLQVAAEYFFAFPVTRYFGLSTGGLLRGEIWQLITYQFLHGNWIHLLVNCVGIYFFGRELEHALGRTRMLVFYFSAGVLGGLLHAGCGLLIPQRFAAPVVGASAGVYGLVAAFASMFPERVLSLLLFFVIPINMRAKHLLLLAGITTLIGIAFPFGKAAHLAHLGGLLAGMAYVKYGLEWKWPRWRPKPRRSTPRLVRVGRAKSDGWSPDEDLSPGEYLSQEVDPILDKISAHGIQSLTDRERKILERARDRMGRR